MDYPRPQIDDTANFLEAASLSASFRASARPSKPLKIVIAGAGQELSMPSLIAKCVLFSLYVMV